MSDRCSRLTSAVRCCSLFHHVHTSLSAVLPAILSAGVGESVLPQWEETRSRKRSARLLSYMLHVIDRAGCVCVCVAALTSMKTDTQLSGFVCEVCFLWVSPWHCHRDTGRYWNMEHITSECCQHIDVAFSHMSYSHDIQAEYNFWRYERKTEREYLRVHVLQQSSI